MKASHLCLLGFVHSISKKGARRLTITKLVENKINKLKPATFLVSWIALNCVELSLVHMWNCMKPVAAYLINSERVAIKRQIGQRVKSAFTICSPYYPNGKVLLTSRYEKIINCIQSIACLFWLSIAQNVIFTTPMPNCSWIFNSSPLNRLPCADISMFRSNNDYLWILNYSAFNREMSMFCFNNYQVKKKKKKQV